MTLEDSPVSRPFSARNQESYDTLLLPVSDITLISRSKGQGPLKTQESVIAETKLVIRHYTSSSSSLFIRTYVRALREIRRTRAMCLRTELKGFIPTPARNSIFKQVKKRIVPHTIMVAGAARSWRMP